MQIGLLTKKWNFPLGLGNRRKDVCHLTNNFVQSAILVECLLTSISAKCIPQDLKNVLALKCKGKKMLKKVVSFLSSQSHICDPTVNSCLIIGSTSAILLTGWVKSCSFYWTTFLEYIMLQMISMKSKLAFASQQKPWGLAPGERQSSTWLLMLPFAGAGSNSSRELLCFVPVQPGAAVRWEDWRLLSFTIG